METNKGPELTLHPEQKEEEVVQAQPVQDLSEDLSVDYKQFNEAEIQQIHDFSQQIDITDNTMIMQYGINAQEISGFFRFNFGKGENQRFRRSRRYVESGRWRVA